MYRYITSFFGKKEVIKKEEVNKENDHQSMIDKIEKCINMKLIIEHKGFIYGPCIRNILANIENEIIDISLPTEDIFTFIEIMKKHNYEYNSNLSIVSQTYVLTKFGEYSLRLVEQDHENHPDFDIDTLSYDGYVISNKYDESSVMDIYNKIKSRKAKIISTSYDYTLAENNFTIEN